MRSQGYKNLTASQKRRLEGIHVCTFLCTLLCQNAPPPPPPPPFWKGVFSKTKNLHPSGPNVFPLRIVPYSEGCLVGKQTRNHRTEKQLGSQKSCLVEMSENLSSQLGVKNAKRECLFCLGIRIAFLCHMCLTR